MDKSYDRMCSHSVPDDLIPQDEVERRLKRLTVVAESLGNIGHEIKLEMFAQMHDPLVAVALANWSDRIIDLAVYAHCGASRPV